MRAHNVLAVVLLAVSCVKEISNEERIEQGIGGVAAADAPTAGELTGLKCDDIDAELAKARDPSRSEEGRLSTYLGLFDRAKERTQRFEEALARNPDLRYRAGNEDIVLAQESCIQTQAEVRLDLENLVREVTQMPTVDEIRGGSTVKVARLRFDVLRDAIDALALDDRDSLLTRLNSAERQLEETPDRKSRRER